jgi:hypothetical protein
MKHKKIILTLQDCNDVISKEILIGADNTTDGFRKRFTFNPWMSEYSIWKNNIRINRGRAQAIEELLEEYNEL